MFSIRNATPLIALVVSISAAHAANETVLHTFEYDISGADPIAGLLRDSTGNLYGTTSLGGAFNKGTVFKIDTSGAETVLLNFQGPNGSFPVAALVSDSSGNLYGTTVSGGASDNGVVFKLDASGKETLLHSFAGAPDGASPEGGVVLDPQGNLYGATYYGGSTNAGVIYKVDTSGNETVLYTFTSVRDDGYPLGNLIIDSRGNLYGTASGGYGAVYELEKSGTLRVLHQFTYSLDGEQPRAGLTADSAGNLYGTTFLGGSGGSNGCDYDECGTVFKIDTSGQETIIHNFTGVNDGSNPAGPLILDSQGNLFGTTTTGGTSYVGTVFEISASGAETVLYSFSPNEPNTPRGGVVLDSAGNLYGTTYYDSNLGDEGGVFMLDTSGQETPIYVFTEGAGAGAGGYSPLAGLIQDPAGNLYGTTFAGGAGAGAVFMLSPGKVTVLYSFTGGADGGAPAAGVIRDTSGNLYGTTELGGLDTGGHHCCGVVFRVDTSGHETVLYTFTGGDDGSEPVAGLVRDSQGNLYGTTEDGGAYGLGVIFKLDSSGNETVLAESPSADVALPKAGLFLDPQGNLYGTTSEGGTNRCGNVFKIDPVGNFTDLFSFTCGAEGGNPLAGVIEDADGNLYGAAGNVYKLDASGNETVLYTFTGGDDGGGKVSGLVRDSVGNLYGTTSNGGNSNNGVVFKVSPAGQETVLLDLPGGASGSRTKASLLLDSAGNLYGTTPLGGIEDGGVVFEVSR